MSETTRAARASDSEITEMVKELRKVIKGDICNQFHPNYQKEVKSVWNARLHDKKPLMFVNAECPSDILETLKFCKSNKVPHHLGGFSFTFFHTGLNLFYN